MTKSIILGEKLRFDSIKTSQDNSHETEIIGFISKDFTIGNGRVWIDDKVALSPEARNLGNYVIGIQGMGKSNLLKQIALTDIENNEGVCVISPHPDLTRDILMRIPEDRWDDVIVFDPSDERPVGLNIFEWEGPKSGIPVDKITDDVVTKTFQLLWADSWGPRMEEMMANVARTILFAQFLPKVKRPTLAEFEMIVGRGKDNKYREYLLSEIRKNYKTRGIDLLVRYWNWFDEQDARFKEQIASSTLNKARPFAANELVAHVVGQSTNKVDFRNIMDESKILLVDLNVDKLGSGNVELLGSLVVGRLFLAALSRKIDPPPPRFHIIADEFGYFATPAFAALQDQARKFGVDVLVAHQRRGQLDPETRDATKTSRNWVVFNVNPEDARELSEAFDSTPPEELETRMEREPLGYASYPWDELKRQAHDNKEVTNLVHEIDKELVLEAERDLSEWVLYQLPFSDYAREKGTHSVYVKRNSRGVDEYTKMKIYLTNFKVVHELNNFIMGLNRMLYLMMTGEEKNIVEPLLYELCERTFTYIRLSSSFWGSSISEDRDWCWVKKDSDGSIHYDPELSPDGGKTALAMIEEAFVVFQNSDRNIWKKYNNDYAKFRCTSEIFQNLAIIYTRVYHRSQLLRSIQRLGELLCENPVWVRGGQPVVEYEKPRPRVEVTLEWKNRFAHLPRYEAWCRLQEGREIKEYHIRTIEIAPPPSNGEEIAQQIRRFSRKKYGVTRTSIEKMMATRIAFEEEGKIEDVETLSD